MATSENPKINVELSVSCKNLKDKDVFSKSDPLCVLFLKDFGGTQFREFGRTEEIKNTLNPVFARKFTLDYYFEISQKLKFELYDIDSASQKLSEHDFLGRIEVTLGEIVGAPGSKIHRQLFSSKGTTGTSGSIIVSAEIVDGSKEAVVMKWRGTKLDKKDLFGKSDPFLEFHKVNDDGGTTLVHRTEYIRNTLNPTWNQFKLSVRQLCNDNHERKIRIDCYDWNSSGTHSFIGSCETNYLDLSSGPGSKTTFELINEKKKAKKGKGYKNSGFIALLDIRTYTEYSFLDYIRGGTQLHFTVAVDFTASNGNPNKPNSLHYIHPYQPNQYMMALRAVGDIIADYDSDKLFPSLGFGAKMPNGQVSHEFFMNFSQTDPHCRGVDGILEAYRRSLMSVQLYGPTNFSPVINHVAKFAASVAQDGSNYFVLLIITDGVITDFEQTKAAIVNAASLPMSIIIVGVGNAEFDAMDALDGDHQRLSSGGRYAERDIVQFVPFREYIQQGSVEMSQARLAKDVLFEVPLQLTSWMQARRIEPKPPKEMDVASLAVQEPGHNQQGTQVPLTGPSTGQSPVYQAPSQQPYATPNQSYGTPVQTYSTHQQPYGNPQQAYGTPQQSYGTPHQQYGTPQQAYGNQQYGTTQQPYYGTPQQPYTMAYCGASAPVPSAPGAQGWSP